MDRLTREQRSLRADRWREQADHFVDLDPVATAMRRRASELELAAAILDGELSTAA